MSGAKLSLMPKHFSYIEVAPELLVNVGHYRDTERIVRMHRVAADALTRMMGAAAAAGIELVPISGFRSVEYQAKLFAKGIEKRGSELEASRWVAPPGCSEHHTGFAIDIGEGPDPESDAEPKFGDTAAYRWLQQNAAGFGFEMSFPMNNAQGVGCEPWHWRFVGTPEAQEVFAASREFNSIARSK
jgi:zinc D-Ala-D-Ala carboxypeptidase